MWQRPLELLYEKQLLENQPQIDGANAIRVSIETAIGQAPTGSKEPVSKIPKNTPS
jgi:hypothetical protein